MLALRPDLVRAAEVRDFPSAAEAIERDFALLRAKPPLGFAWAASDLNPEGAVGEADKATAEKGEAAIAYGVERFIALLRDVQAFDLAPARRRPARRRRRERAAFRVRARGDRRGLPLGRRASTRSGAARSPGRSASPR